MTLTGLQRFQIMRAWLKRGMPGHPEDFVKKVCEQKKIKYVPLSKATEEKR